MKRETFLQRTFGGMVAAISGFLFIQSCSSSDDAAPAPTPTANCLDNGTSSSISANHGHTLSVSKADVMSGVEQTYGIAGTASHGHTVTVTADQFLRLKSNQSISVMSTDNDGHTHSVTISCA